MSSLSGTASDGRISDDVSRASSPHKLDTNLAVTPSAESYTTTPASTVNTPGEMAVAEQPSMPEQGAEGHDVNPGTETPRKPDVHPVSLESQIGELQARLESLEMQRQSESKIEKMMDIMEQKMMPKDYPAVTTTFMESLRILEDEEPDLPRYLTLRMHRLLEFSEDSSRDYVSRAIRLFEAEIQKLRDAKNREAQFEEERYQAEQQRDKLLKKELLWKKQRQSLLKKLDRLRNHGAVKGPSFDGDDTIEQSPDESDCGESVSSEQDLPPVSKAELIYLDWQHFNLRYAKEAQPSAIEVLEGDPVLSWETTKPKSGLGNISTGGRATVTYSLASEDRSKPRKTKFSMPGQAPLPERIRINSTLILKILEDIRSDSDDSDSDEISLPALIMVRPYKFLTCHDKSIRLKFQELEGEFGQKILETEKEITTGSPREQNIGASDGVEELITESEEQVAPESGGIEENGSTTSADGGQESTFSLPAYEHMRCLIQFMDEHLIKKMTYLSSDRCQTVAFSDIWHLFKPGDEVIEQSGLQAYRIMSISSAPHKAFSPYRPRDDFNNEGRAQEDTPVVLFCVHVDFEGKDLGPRVRKVTIARFDGERPVTALEVYPLRFAEGLGTHGGGTEDSGADEPHGRAALRQRLIDRGRFFMSMTKFKHMHYSGLTLDTRDEVDSHVVVDFEEAFTRAVQKETDGSEDDSSDIVYDSSPAQQAWRPKLNKLAGRALEEDFEDANCDAECCKNQSIHDDAHVEKKRNEEYRALLMPQDRQREPPPTIYPRTLSLSERGEISISEEDLVIMSHRVFGFVLRTRKWAKLDLNHLSLPDGHTVDDGLKGGGINDRDEKDAQGTRHEDQTAFGHLVLPSGHKEMVKALIAQHFRDKDAASMESKMHQVDIVRGKGKGLIILLHGAPGVGKTTTAEGVAEMFQKPLFQITCGDLGTSAREVEEALEMHFTLANRWGCILLLDEADVFLAARSKQDFERNGLVSVFLRVLEYYAGILFLTTNRVGDFDEAFASRIHISLYYPQLDCESTKSIFQLNLKMILERFKSSGRKISIEEKAIRDSATTYFNNHPEERWNGRQIRNACQTALALAEYRAQGSNHVHKMNLNAHVELKAKDLETVAEAYLHFIKYINSILGQDASRHAKQMRLRAREPAKEEVQGNRGPQSVTDRPAATLTPRAPGGPWSPPPPASPSTAVPQPVQQPIHLTGIAMPPTHYGANLGVPAGYYPPHPSQTYGQPQASGAPQHAVGAGQAQPVYYIPHPQYQQPQAYGQPPDQVPGYGMASPAQGSTGPPPASSQPQ